MPPPVPLMRLFPLLVALAAWFLFLKTSQTSAHPQINDDTSLKRRVLVLTDVVENTVEPDDAQSLVRLLVNADKLQIDGFILTTGWNFDSDPAEKLPFIAQALDAYEHDLPNLMKRSGQQGFVEDETNQRIGYWPSPAYLRTLVKVGQPKRGLGGIGEGKATEGSNWITNVVDRVDDSGRPIYVSFWGSGNTLAQSLFDLQSSRTPEELATFVDKIRIFAITDQDRPFHELGDLTDIEDSTHPWMRETFPELHFIWSDISWSTMGTQWRDESWPTFQSRIQGQGALGRFYPDYKFIVEGDTPAWLHVIPGGPEDPEDPTTISFAGRFAKIPSPDNRTDAFMDIDRVSGDTTLAEISNAAVIKYAQELVNDFVARMAWVADGKGNRNPNIVVNGEVGYAPVVVHAKSNTQVVLDAGGTSDPEEDAITYLWERDATTGFMETIDVSGEHTSMATVHVPEEAAEERIHFILRVVDNGSPPLATNRRVIIEVDQ